MVIYKKFFNLITNKWVIEPVETDSSMVEIAKPNREVLKKLGLFKRGNEIQKQFTSDDNT